MGIGRVAVSREDRATFQKRHRNLGTERTGCAKSLGKRARVRQGAHKTPRQDLDLFEESGKTVRGRGGVRVCWVSRRDRGTQPWLRLRTNFMTKMTVI